MIITQYKYFFIKSPLTDHTKMVKIDKINLTNKEVLESDAVYKGLVCLFNHLDRWEMP